MHTKSSVVLVCLIFSAACDCSATPEVDGTCETSAECGDGVCVDGLCVDRMVTGECDEDRPCDAGFMCVANTCVDPGPDCIDADGDGRGVDCAAGPDCDDTDRMQTGVEICDGFDNDCDGEADNGVLSECGDCDSTCRRGGIGGDDEPFMPDEMNSDGVGTDEDGALILDSRRINTDFIWIANTSEGTVSRLSTEAPYNEVGRYFTGPAGTGNDPSRTSVNSAGDAFVGNRRGTSISRISVLGTDCPDTNGDGVITTSQDLNGDGIIQRDGSGELLPWGEDDCVLWNRELNDIMPGENLVRAVAAQDIEGPDGEIIEYVWVGGYSSQIAAKLDGVTGEPVIVTRAPTRTYGFALDGRGQLWISGFSAASIGRIDTTRCIDDASCMVDICAEAHEGGACDDAIKSSIVSTHQNYGITVDFNQRVWIGGLGIARYDPTAAPGSRWMVSTPAAPSYVHGIGADAEGYVWGAGTSSGVFRVDAETGMSTTVAGTSGVANKGMAVDSDGKIWSVTQSNQAVVITPGPGLMDATVETGVGATTLVGNYTYSDMTGLQLRLATNPRGFYHHIFEGCDPERTADGLTDWGELRFDAETPAMTSVSFRVRTAPTREELDSAEWITVGMTPPDTSPFDLAAILMDAGVTPDRYLMVEVVLRSDRSSTAEVVTPRVLSIDATHSCPPIFG